MGLDTGEIFRLSQVQEVMQKVTDLYGDQGYASPPVPLTSRIRSARSSTSPSHHPWDKMAASH